jgi:hypothetical protein
MDSPYERSPSTTRDARKSRASGSTVLSAEDLNASRVQIARVEGPVETLPKISLQAFQACQPSSQQDALLFLASQPDANRLLISVPVDQLLTLIDLTAAGRMVLRKLTGVDPNERDAKAVSRWEWIKDATTGEIVLSLTFGSGGRLDFWLPGAMPARMLEGFQAVMGKIDAAPAGTIVS